MSIVYFRIAARGSPRALRAPALERVIARADEGSHAAPWRREAWRAIAPDGSEPPAIAVAQLRASGDFDRHEWAAMATPVHLVAGMSNVVMPSDGILEIDAHEADILAADFNRVFGSGGTRLARVRGSGLVCLFDARIAADTTSPEDASGGDVWAHQPRGEGAARLRRLSSEIEMWLFDHEVNAARRARSIPVISALWLWGAGTGDAPWPRVEGWTAGDDGLFSAFDRRDVYPPAVEPGAKRGRTPPGVVAMPAWPGTAAWEDLEQRWLAPALADLRAGRLDGIEISAAEQSLRLSARNLRRFWRRSRPWWHSFEIPALPAEEDSHVDGGSRGH